MLPSEPFALAGGRLVVSGEVAAAVAPEDTGYFNYTDYEQSALRQVRAGLTTALSLGAKASVLGEVRTETGKAFDVYAMFLRFRPWDERTVDVQVGRIPPTFGAFSRRDYGIDNPLIGYPLAYQYLTSLRADALPANADRPSSNARSRMASKLSDRGPISATGVAADVGVAMGYRRAGQSR